MKHRLQPPYWARYWGEDKKGAWVTLLYKGIEQRFRYMAPGEFLMGSPANEAEHSDRETQHRVRITQGYWLAETPVTQALYEALTGSNPSQFNGKQNPVDTVSWDDAQAFISQLNQERQTSFRLPTEAQWEYACRAGTTTPFSFGETINSTQVNFDGTEPYNNSPASEYRETTVAVASLPANAWGLYEMHGNVWEWCSDWYDDYDTTETIVINPQGPSSGGLRVLRGGSWDSVGWGCRSAYRFSLAPDIRGNSLGFRLSSGHQETE